VGGSRISFRRKKRGQNFIDVFLLPAAGGGKKGPPYRQPSVELKDEKKKKRCRRGERNSNRQKGKGKKKNSLPPRQRGNSLFSSFWLERKREKHQRGWRREGKGKEGKRSTSLRRQRFIPSCSGVERGGKKAFWEGGKNKEK